MRKILLLACLSSCGTITEMNRHVSESTSAIEANSCAIASATEAIHENRRLVQESTQALKANEALLK